MSNPPPTNQRRQSLRNRQPPQPPPAANQRQVRYVRKQKYENSFTTEGGLFIVSKRKRALTPEQKTTKVESKRQKKIGIKTQQVRLAVLRHKVVALWDHGMCMPN